MSGDRKAAPAARSGRQSIMPSALTTARAQKRVWRKQSSRSSASQVTMNCPFTSFQHQGQFGQVYTKPPVLCPPCFSWRFGRLGRAGTYSLTPAGLWARIIGGLVSNLGMGASPVDIVLVGSIHQRRMPLADLVDENRLREEGASLGSLVEMEPAGGVSQWPLNPWVLKGRISGRGSLRH